MSIFNHKNSLNKAEDSALVIASLGGEKEAFCEIVSRYQTLLCSIAYASLGDIKHSEDLAQEVFVEAWQKLSTLREPAKIKSWLCGILRFKISHFRQAQNKQVTTGADNIDVHTSVASTHLKLEDEAIDTQQEGLLWETLSSIDVTYREPLVLYYREQQSLETVAEQLDLTVSTAKQRLSRGRKLLKTTVEKVLAETLQKTTPGTAFTTAVFIALEDITKHAAAAAIGAGAVKSGSIVKSVAFMPFVAVFSGILSSLFGLKAGLYQSRTENERRLTIKVVILFFVFAGIFTGVMYGLKYAALSYPSTAQAFAIVSQLVVAIFIASYLILMKKIVLSLGQLRAQERIFHPEAFTREIDDKSSKKRDYVSRFRLFGIPLFHFQFGMPELNQAPAVAWVAGGSQAYGVLFAWGGLAVAPIAVGIVSVGIVSCGAIGVGVFSVGTVAIGVLAFGASAIGYNAYAAFSSLGWDSAVSGGFSIAREAAVGPVALAKNTNTELAYELAHFTLFEGSYLWILSIIAMLVIIPAYLNFKEVRRRIK